MVAKTELSSYEQQRLQNIEDNKKMLESLGLLRSFKPILDPIVKKKTIIRKPKPAVKRKFEDIQQNTEEKYGRRRSLRVKGIEPDGTLILPEDDDEEYRQKTRKINREHYFGAPDPAFYIGYHWDTRMECSADGIHHPTVAGISGTESIGCYSIALSGGYEDDLDYGESFTFTGSGGRDLKGTKSNPKNLRTAPQSKDQTLDKMNLALSRNVESRDPVRVIRGFKLRSAFAPEYGYRYDGLYTVEKCWPCTGLSGFRVYKYVLKRVADQPPPPWKEIDGKRKDDSNKENEAPVESKEEVEEVIVELPDEIEKPMELEDVGERVVNQDKSDEKAKAKEEEEKAEVNEVAVDKKDEHIVETTKEEEKEGVRKSPGEIVMGENTVSEKTDVQENEV